MKPETTQSDNSFHAAISPLRKGVNLVEASAGTGKTFAIAMLVLRFVTEEKIDLQNILIVTFTNAAAGELRGRIRKRLVEARDILEDAESADQRKQSREQFDRPLLDWAEKFAAGKQREEAILRLKLAICSVDEAPIFTIHGFCRRMLTEQALESNQPFDCELLSDVTPLCREIARDFWRALFYHNASAVEATLLADKRFADPDTLLASVGTLDARMSIIPTVGDPAAKKQALAREFADIRRWWSASREAFYDKLTCAEERGYLKKDCAGEWRQWVESLDRWCDEENAPLFLRPEWLIEQEFVGQLSGTKLRGDKKAAFVADLPFYPEAECFCRRLQDVVLCYRVQFAEFLKKELPLRLERQGCIGFDGIIGNLADALENDRSGQLQTGQLQTGLAGRFAVALIDEFQDTDGAQYTVFNTLFGGGHFLYLIGDPKQAIYSFRGADIHSYFAARRRANTILTLDTNYRSHPLLIAEINRLFAGRKNPFLYAEAELPFFPVKARSREECAELTEADGTPACGMVYRLLPPNEPAKDKRWGAGAARTLIMQHTVAEIGRLLTAGRYCVREGEQQRPLAPCDIAVLVRNNDTGERYANALAEAGIPAVVTARTSVFSTEECNDLLLLLAAVLSPNSVRRAKAALTLSWFGLDGGDIYQIGEDESRLGRWQLRLTEYGRMWRNAGFFSMMTALLREEKVFAALALGRRAERRISNLRRLLVLIEEETLARKLSPREVYLWLLRQNRQPQGVSESELPLESDGEAVQIVTMHSAKGLEYGVVFCVDLWSGSDRLSREQNRLVYTENEKRVLDLGSDAFATHLNKAKEERQAEDLRLLYVALTRAKMRCYTVWADVKKQGISIDSFHSALGYLLFPNLCAEGCDYSCQQQRIAARAAKEGVSFAILPAEAEMPADAVLHPVPAEALQTRQRRRRSIGSCRCLSSFSSLAGLSEYDYEIALESVEEPQAQPTEIDVVALPVGARFGSVIHDIFENSSFADQAADGVQWVERCRETAALYGVSADAEKLAELVRQTLQTPLQKPEETAHPGDAFSLSSLADDDCIKEMPFYLAHEAVNTEKIYALLKDDPTVVPLAEKEIAGYLTGFIDLICQRDGRYYLMDYKTNYLGNYLDDYRGEALLTAMRSHNYGLQYWLYTVALHRYLGNMAADYEYGKHFGGVFYLFVRGMTPKRPGNGVFFTIPPEEQVRKLDTLLGGAQ